MEAFDGQVIALSLAEISGTNSPPLKGCKVWLPKAEPEPRALVSGSTLQPQPPPNALQRAQDEKG